MSNASTQRVLKNLLRTINHKYATGQIDKQRQIVTITIESLIQSFLEGYVKVLDRRPDLPDGLGWDWEVPAQQALESAYLHAKKGATKTSVVEYIPNVKLVIASPSNVASFYKDIKDFGVSFVQSQLKDLNSAPLTDATAEWERQGRTGRIRDFEGKSNISAFKRGVERHHKGRTTVGSARLALSLKWLSGTKFFKDFTQSEEAKSLEDKYGDVRATYKTVGSGKKIKLRLQETIQIAIEIAPSSQNFSKSEDTDWGHIEPELIKAVNDWASKQDWWTQKGSNSLEEDYTTVAMNAVTEGLAGSTGKITPKPKKVSRKYKEQLLSTGASALKHPGSKKKASVRAPKARKGASAKPLQILAVINKQLPERVAANMGLPALQYQSGRFARSAQLTNVTTTPQGFPSLGYTYMRYPYEVFEIGSGSALSSPQRDPRQLIEKSIRELAAGFAVGRFYLRRT